MYARTIRYYNELVLEPITFVLTYTIILRLVVHCLVLLINHTFRESYCLM